MEAIHKLKVICPYEIIKIEDIEISSKPNEHGYLYLKCLIDDNIKFKYSIEATTEDTIILYEELESGEKSILFNGIIENISTTNENGIYYLELEGASRSSLLDIKEKSRSFQDVEMSYDNLINEILKDYKVLGFTQCMSRPMSIGKPLFQYKETDYEFLKRVASLLGLEVICDIINPGNAFYFGRPEGELYELKDEINYKACKDLERYYKAQTRDFGVEFHDTDFFYYEVENSIKMDIGNKIYFKQKDLYVNQYEAKLHKGDFIYTYRFCRKKGIWQEKIYNHKIKGISLEGEVLEAAGEKLKLHLYIDESQDPSKAAWFYYTPPTGNILYSMPLVGESATLYFQDEIDSSPIVTSCVRKNGSTCEAMADTTNRYFATESGNYLDMLPGAINFHRSGLNVSFNDDNGIDFSSFGNLSVGASGGVSLSAGSVSISATSKLLVQKGKTSYVSLENEFYAEASVVYESGSSRESYAPFTDDEPTAGAAEAKAKLEQQLKQAAFKEKQLMEAMPGSEAKAGECMSSDKDGSSNNDANIFDETMSYENGADVTFIAADGTEISGKAYQAQAYEGHEGKQSQFMPDDWGSYSEHDSPIKSAGSSILAGGDVVQETFWEGAKLMGYLPQFCEFVGSKLGLTDYNQVSWDSARERCDQISSDWHNNIRNIAPYERIFDISKPILNVASAVMGMVGMVGSITNIPKMLSGGLKVAGFANNALQAEKVLNINVAGIGKLGGSGLFTAANISNIIENSDRVETKDGKRNTRSENSLRRKLENRTDDEGNRVYSDEEIDAIMDIRNSEYELTLENGDKITIKRHGYQKTDAQGQSHHLNQDAAYREIIPKEEGLAIDADGNIFIDKESSHYKAHETLENFWDRYRDGGEMEGIKPTVGEYNSALKKSMKNSGFSENDADIIVEIAANQQRAYGLTEVNEVPRIPGKINAIER